MRLSLGICVLAAALAGCATPRTVRDVEAAGPRLEFQTGAEPAVVYRRVLERARECLQAGSLKVDGDYFSDISRGRITVVGPAQRVLLTTTVESGALRASSQVKVSYVDAGVRELFVAPVQAWAEGDAGDCLADRYRPRPGFTETR